MAVALLLFVEVSAIKSDEITETTRSLVAEVSSEGSGRSETGSLLKYISPLKHASKCIT